MSFLPDIEDGQIKEEPKVSALYTPPKRVRPIAFEADTERPDKPYYKDAPRMQDMHECVPDKSMECLTCGREMLI